MLVVINLLQKKISDFLILTCDRCDNLAKIHIVLKFLFSSLLKSWPKHLPKTKDFYIFMYMNDLHRYNCQNF